MINARRNPKIFFIFSFFEWIFQYFTISNWKIFLKNVEKNFLKQDKNIWKMQVNNFFLFLFSFEKKKPTHIQSQIIFHKFQNILVFHPPLHILIWIFWFLSINLLITKPTINQNTCFRDPISHRNSIREVLSNFRVKLGIYWCHWVSTEEIYWFSKFFQFLEK